MKRILALMMSLILFTVPLTVGVSAANIPNRLVSSSTEYLENGDYVITEIFEPSIQMRAGKTGAKTLTYYNSAGNAVFAVTVNGTFSYTYGSSSSATGASAVVDIYNTNAKFVSKNAYTSGASAVAVGNVRYNASNASKTATLTCDRYGNLS